MNNQTNRKLYDDDFIIGDLRDEILSLRKDSKQNDQKSPEDYETILLQQCELNGERLACVRMDPGLMYVVERDPVKPWIDMTKKEEKKEAEKEKKRRVPRKWFAPFYYTYCWIKNKIKNM